jgi:serine protease AprX
MNKPVAPGRIRWAVAWLALAASALVPTAAEAASGRDRHLEVIVQMDAGRAPAAGKSAVRAAGGRVTGDLPIINGFGAELSADAAEQLAAADGVKAVTPDGAVEPQDVKASDLATAYPFSTAATNTWNSTPATGKGVGVAVIDTGIAGDLRDFRVSPSDSRSRVVATAQVNPNSTKAGDQYGHGTHVAGIIAGNSWNRSSLDLLQGRYAGVAPDANLIDVKVSDDNGDATILDVLYGLQFAVDFKDQLGIRVVNLSLESTVPQSYKVDPLDAAVEAAWFKGLVVVAAAGNRGVASDAVSYAPGNDPYVISVGGTDDGGTRNLSDDELASWSARGVTQDGIAKPEINAPGARIVSNLAPGSQFAAMCPTCVLTGGMIRAGGTSMAAPMVAGAAALLLERYPNLTPNQVKGVLMASARDLPGGLPGLDTYAALRRVASGSIPVANQGLIPNPLVSAATGEIDYSRSSWSRSSWSSSTGAQSADWSRSSWSRSSWSSYNSSGVETSRSSWSRSSWSTSWTK